jgi:hypothetical protein
MEILHSVNVVVGVRREILAGCCCWFPETGTSSIYWAHVSRCHLKTETGSSLRKVVLKIKTWRWIMSTIVIVMWHYFCLETSIGWKYQQLRQQGTGKNFIIVPFLLLPQEPPTCNKIRVVRLMHYTSCLLLLPCLSLYTCLQYINSILHKADAYRWTESVPEQQMLVPRMQISRFLNWTNVSSS